MADAVESARSGQLSVSTVKRTIDGVAFTLKALHRQPATMNTEANREQRRDYLVQLIAYQSEGKSVYYVDETNFNIWCSRGVGWSRRGSRATLVDTASKGANMHVIACVSASGLAYWERRYGSYRKDDCRAVLMRLLDYLCTTTSLADVWSSWTMLHAIVELRMCLIYQDATLLRLGPYSPILNPIEKCFFAFKSAVKRFLYRHDARAIQRTPAGITQKDHRQSFLAQTADICMPEVVTPELCAACAWYTLSFHVPVLLMHPVKVGS